MSSITVRINTSSRNLFCPEGVSALEVLRKDPWVKEMGADLTTPCGGTGRCGKCRVSVERNGKFTEENLCQLKTEDGMILILRQVQKDPHGTDAIELSSEGLVPTDHVSYREGIGAAVDIGTTTVALKVYDLSTMEVLGSCADWNAQGTFGSDVISRIRFCMDHTDGLNTLSSCIRLQIRKLLETALEKSSHTLNEITEMVVAGNTVMQHLFAGIDPTSIGQAPFIPETCFSEDTFYSFPEYPGASVRLIPCVSGYIGGDIVAGMLFADLSADPADKDTTRLLLDIGTNGEIVLQSNGKLYACSTACGPAFEGAEITCGMRGLPGAIEHISVKDHRFDYKTIGNAPAEGFCGSGLIDLLSLLLQEEIVDESGRLLPPDEVPDEVLPYITEDEDENGVFQMTPDGPSLYASDVRKLQLAKAAVCAGVRTLEDHAGASHDTIEEVLIAGGFGKHIDLSNLIHIGMIPETDISRIRAIGNSALAGCEMLLMDPSLFNKMQILKDQCHYIELSTDPSFTELFMEEMFFSLE